MPVAALRWTVTTTSTAHDPLIHPRAPRSDGWAKTTRRRGDVFDAGLHDNDRNRTLPQNSISYGSDPHARESSVTMAAHDHQVRRDFQAPRPLLSLEGAHKLDL